MKLRRSPGGKVLPLPFWEGEYRAPRRPMVNSQWRLGGRNDV